MGEAGLGAPGQVYLGRIPRYHGGRAEANTGEEIWRSLTSKSPGYSAPIIYEIGGARQLMIWHGEAINSLDPETGEVYWSIPIETWSGMAIATPRLLGDRLFVMGFQHRSTMIAMDKS